MPSNKINGGVGTSSVHDSAQLHVTGQAHYLDDLPLPSSTLFAAIGVSSHAHASITSLNLDSVRKAPGVVAVVTAKDIPGENQLNFFHPDEPIIASTLVEYVGQPLFAVAAQSIDQARMAVNLAQVEYNPLPSILTVEHALDKKSFIVPSECLSCGNASNAIKNAPHHLKGQLKVGG